MLTDEKDPPCVDRPSEYPIVLDVYFVEIEHQKASVIHVFLLKNTIMMVISNN